MGSEGAREGSVRAVKRRGQVYDIQMRLLVENNLPTLCEFIGLETEGEPEILPADFAAQKREVDLLIRVGPGRLAQIEYVHTARADLAMRMLRYRGSIDEKYPDDELVQYIIVLGGGTVRGHDDFAGRHFTLDLKVIYVRKLPTTMFLSSPTMAVLAALGSGSQADREKALAAALELIASEGGEKASSLIDSATDFAQFTLEPSIIDEIFEEAKMRIELPRSVMREIGRNDTRYEEREGALVWMLRERFGDHDGLREIAYRLARWDDAEAAFQAVRDAENLAALR